MAEQYREKEQLLDSALSLRVETKEARQMTFAESAKEASSHQLALCLRDDATKRLF